MMKTLCILFLLFIAPALSFAQDDKTGDCATADSVLMHMREAGSPANMSLTKNSGCQLVLEIEGYTIVKFDISMTMKGEYKTKSVKGAELTKSIQSALAKAPKGTKVLVHSIMVKDAAGKVVKIEEREFKL